jgi:heme-degrading monooxygenase HmoA
MFGWMTARRIKAGQMAEFRKGWEGVSESRPDGLISESRPDGLTYDYFLQDTQDRNRMIGLSIWRDRAAYEVYVKTETEAGRRQTMSPNVEAVEEERFFEVTEY